MPIQKTITLYTFDELSKESQEEAVNNLRNINVDSVDWYSHVLDSWYEKLNAKGFDGENEISFSGFCSQGDGASFTASDFNFFTLLKKQIPADLLPLLKKADEYGCFDCSITRNNSHYYHEYSTDVNLDFCPGYAPNNTFTDEEIEQIEKWTYDVASPYIKEAIITLNKQIYKDLKNEDEALTSDEAVKDTILANEYTFEADGTMNNL